MSTVNNTVISTANHEIRIEPFQGLRESCSKRSTNGGLMSRSIHRAPTAVKPSEREGDPAHAWVNVTIPLCSSVFGSGASTMTCAIAFSNDNVRS